MASTAEHFKVVFPEDFDERSAFEAPFRGYLGGILVHLQDGSRYQLFFYDPVRLQQDLAAHTENLGQAYLAEPNMIVVPEVTADSIRKAVEGLVKDGYFQHLKPL